MSIGNLKDQGNKGNNFPYQLRTLQLLDAINQSISALPGVDHESRTSTYQATCTICGPGYSNGDIIIRYDIIDLGTGLIDTTIWFNDTLQTQLVPDPLPGDLTPISAPSGVTVLNGPAGAAVNIQDGGNSITVDANNLDIRDLAFATDKVDVSGSSNVAVTDGGGSITVDGTVAVSNFPATQPVSGTVAATQSGTWNINNISGTISLPTGAATQTTLVDIYNNTYSKMNRIKGAANYTRAFTYLGSGDVDTITHTGTTLLGPETIVETFSYSGGNVSLIVYS